MTPYYFISYSSADAQDFALQLADALEAGPPSIPVWLDKRDIPRGFDWDTEIAKAITTCAGVLFVMTQDSVENQSICKNEWGRALRYKKPVIPLLLHRNLEPPFRLEHRQYIDFTGSFEQGLATLHQHLRWLNSPEGVLHTLKDRLEDAQRDLRRETDPNQQARIRAEIDQLQQQIAEPGGPAPSNQHATQPPASVKPPKTRRPVCPVINPPPTTAPRHFQNRYVEMGIIRDFLTDESQRLMIISGRVGAGKTTLICRLLKQLESGELPYDLGPLDVDGIIYLSNTGSYRVNVPNLYTNLCKLLPRATARQLETFYKQPQASTAAKFEMLLEMFPTGRRVLLLDNLETLLDPETFAIRDPELDEALRTILTCPQHGVKVILTTSIIPRALTLVQPGRQKSLELDQGLKSPDAENILRVMDADGTLGLRDAPPELLAEARERTGGYPRALEALYAILAADRDTSLRDLLTDTAHVMPEYVVKELVEEAFNRLDPRTQQVMQALAIYGRPVRTEAVDYLLQPSQPGGNSAPILSRLVTMRLVRKEARRYYLHPVDREYALSRIPQGTPADAQTTAPTVTQYALLHRAADYFQQMRTPETAWKTIDDLAPQLAEFELRCAAHEYDTAAGVLLDAPVSKRLLAWGHYRKLITLHERLQGKLDDPQIRQQNIGHLGNAYYRIAQYQQALACYQQAIDLAHGSADRQSEGRWLNNIGACYAARGQIDQAITAYKQALEMFSDNDERHMLPLVLSNLCNRYTELGQTATALTYGRQSLNAAEQNDPSGRAGALGSLGYAYAEQGSLTQALDYYHQALEIARALGARQTESELLGNLGNSYVKLGRSDQALSSFEEALAIAREIGARDFEATWLTSMSNACGNLGKTDQAIDYCRQSSTIVHEIGNRFIEAFHHKTLAEVLIDTHSYAEAIQYSLETVQIGLEIKNPLFGSSGHGRVALAQLYSGDLPAARAAAEAARQYDSIQHNHYVLALLGLIALRQGEVEAARSAFASAVEQADVLLSRTAQLYKVLDSKALALCGLALCEGSQHLPPALAAYRAARAICQEPGVVSRVLALFDALAVADPTGMLAEVSAVAGGTISPPSLPDDLEKVAAERVV
ncbi:MAG TPA: tetratricopeptide repeat protein [Herpetosiphonaceae bacterium]